MREIDENYDEGYDPRQYQVERRRMELETRFGLASGRPIDEQIEGLADAISSELDIMSQPSALLAKSSSQKQTNFVIIDHPSMPRFEIQL